MNKDGEYRVANALIDQAKEYIRQELAWAEKERIKAVRIFIRTLRDAEMITREEKRELLDFAQATFWRAQIDRTTYVIKKEGEA